MVEINPLPFPTPHEPPPKKQESTADADRFNKEMHKRVEKVSETDEEQKKKRKHKQEAEEEEEEPGAAAASATPSGPIAPFSPTESKKTSPLDMQKGGTISPLASAQPTNKPDMPTSPSPAPLMATPSPDEMEDDSGSLEENAFMVNTPEEQMPSATYPVSPPEETPPTPLPTQTEMATPYEAPSEATPSSPSLPSAMPSLETPQKPATPAPKPQETTPSDTDEDQEKSKSIAAGPPSSPLPAPVKGRRLPSPPTTVKPAKGQLPLPPPPTVKPAPAQGEPPTVPLPDLTNEKGFSHAEIEEMASQKGVEETAGFFEQFVEEKEKGVKREIKPKETAQEQADIEGITPIAPLSPSDYIEKEKHEKEREEEIAALGTGSSLGGPIQPGLSAPLIEAPPPSNPYTNLHPAAMDLFDRMVGTMTVMNLSGITETVMTLDAPKFASSVFFGSQIIIQEYSSAPQAFNIQLNGTPEAVALFQGNADDLMAAFQHGNYNFRVNRLETGLLGQKPLIRRKGPASGGKEDERGSK